MSEKVNIYHKLQTVRVALQHSPMKKSGYNPHSKFDYFDLSDFMPAVNRLFHEHGLCSVLTFTKDEATLRVVNADEPSDCIVFSSPMSEAKLPACHAVQNLGAVQTYLRRYLYICALEIVEHDALDATIGDPKAKPVETVAEPAGNDPFLQSEPEYVPPPTTKGGGILAEVRKLAESIGFDAPQIRAWSNHKHGQAFSQLTDNQQAAMRDELADKVAAYKAMCLLMDAEHGTLPNGLTEAEQCDRVTAYIKEKASAKPFNGEPLKAPVEKWNEWRKQLEDSLSKGTR